MRKAHLLSGTIEVFFGPAILCFTTGVIAIFLLIFISQENKKEQIFSLLITTGIFLILIFVWTIIQTGLYIGILIHNALITGYDDELILMPQFWNQWLTLLMLGGPVFLCWNFIKLPQLIRIPRFKSKTKKNENKSPAEKNSLKNTKNIIIYGLIIVCTIMVTFGIFWIPIGERKASRILVDEYHSTWEPTEKPFDTTWFGQDSTYTYYCIYDYLTHFYDMGRIKEQITEDVLKDCDVLILKVPTSKYEETEIKTILNYVKKGGGLLLIGEHTDVFNTSTHLNQIARHLGFEYYPDSLIGIDTPFRQLYTPPLVPHPITQNMPPMHFAVSCSLKTSSPLSRQVIRSTGLRSLYADYHASNYYPQVIDYTDVRFGSFNQILDIPYGDGRVVAFSDSTIFSNFSAFEPGKPELMLGMIEFLNHKSSLGHIYIVLITLGIVLFIVTIFISKRANHPWLLFLCVCLASWSLSITIIRFTQAKAMQLPDNKKPYTKVTIDRTLSDVPLSNGGFIGGEEDGFGIFEQWILRLGYFYNRAKGDAVFDGNLIIFFYPQKKASKDFTLKLKAYVESGGKVLVIDSKDNNASVSNILIDPFGLSFNSSEEADTGEIETPEEWPSVRVESAKIVSGGNPIIKLNGKSVYSSIEYGKGTVYALGFGTRFTDLKMGVTADTIPDERLLNIFNLEFSIIRNIIEGNITNPLTYNEQ